MAGKAGENGGGLRAALTVRDERGLHCRVAALLAYQLRTEAPNAEVTLRTLEGRTANPKKPYKTMHLGARHSGVVYVEATGLDASKALNITRSIVQREPLSRQEVVEAIPEDVGGDVGKIRANQEEQVRRETYQSWADLREQDRGDLVDWKSPGGWIYELVNDAAWWAENNEDKEDCERMEKHDVIYPPVCEPEE